MQGKALRGERSVRLGQDWGPGWFREVGAGRLGATLHGRNGGRHGTEKRRFRDFGGSRDI